LLFAVAPIAGTDGEGAGGNGFEYIGAEDGGGAAYVDDKPDVPPLMSKYGVLGVEPAETAAVVLFGYRFKLSKL
jgi:hypothetical protein